MAQQQETVEATAAKDRAGPGDSLRLRAARPVRGVDSRSGRAGWQPLSSGQVIGWMVTTIFVVIVVTEAVGKMQHESALVEGMSHIFALVATLVPLLYYFWYRPLNQQMHERQRSENEVRELSHRLLTVGEEERCKLARDLHDEFGQKLTSLQMRLESLSTAIASDDPERQKFSGHCRQLASMASDLGDELRLVVADLRPGLLQELGIGSALEVFLDELRGQQPDLKIEFTCSGLRERPSNEVETVLFRVAQEALNNILKHAGARVVSARLAVSFPQIILGIQDDGIGFEPPDGRAPTRLSGFGLVGMRERVASLGGRIHIASRPGRGTLVRVELPLQGRTP